MNILELKKYYKNQAKNKCLELNITSHFSQIVLIRHGEPNVERKGYFTKKEAKTYIENYYSAEIINYKVSPICIDTLPAMSVFHSTLKRAEHTAQLIFPDQKFKLIPSEQFMEFERGPIQIPLIRMPIKWWNILSRFLWFLDIGQKDVESYSKAKSRVMDSAVLLASHAVNNRLAILVAHGIFNKFIGIRLKQMGWKKVYNSGKGYLSNRIYAKETSTSDVISKSNWMNL